jgi:hypothetical protein
MAFSDPQTVTISGTPISLPRVNTGNNGSEYMSSDGLVKLTASNSYGKRNRRVLRLEHSKITTDPFITSTNVKVGMSNYVVFDVPIVGYTAAEALAIWQGFKTQLSASSDALVSKLLAGEN